METTTAPSSSPSKTKSAKWAEWKRFLANIGTISRKEILVFFELLSALNHAGLPLNESLEILHRQNKNPKFKWIIFDVLTDLKNGQSLSGSLSKHPKVFDESICSIISAGEKSGNLNTILKELIAQLHRMDEIHEQVKGVMLYPTIVFCVMGILSVIVLIFVIPKLENIFDGLANLPLPTRILVQGSNILTQYWYLCILGLSGTWALWHLWKKTRRGKYIWAHIMLSIPFFSKLLKKTILARVARMLGLLLQSGVPIVESLRLSSKMAGNVIYKKKLLMASEDLTKGISLAENLSDNEKIFPEVMVNMVAVGEKTATLDHVITRVADYYDEEINREVKSLSKIMEPFILAFIAAGAIFMILAIYLPILRMNDHLI